MPIEAIHHELIRIGKLLNYWQAELFASAWLAIFLGLLWLGGFSDLFLKWGYAGRTAFWLLTISALAAGIWHVRKALTIRRSEESVAARIERAFPQLDNRLINVVQFEASGALDPIRGAYVRQGVPNWDEVQPEQLRERQKQKRAYMALAAAGFLLLVPFCWSGAAWTNALARILNPFSARAPSTIAHIISVSPGDGIISAGNSLTIALTATGRRGQPVTVDLWRSGEYPSSVRLGQLAGAGREDFSYLVPKVDADLDYRISTGDAVSARYHIRSVSPLAFSRIDVTVTPPKELDIPVRHFNGLTDQVIAAEGSQLGISVSTNRPVTHSSIAMDASPALQLASADAGQSFSGALTVTRAGVLQITSDAGGGETADASVRVQLTPDLPPVIRIIAPQGRVILGPGAVPVIQFEASDDFGLTKIAVEKVDSAAADQDAPGKVIQEWPGANQRAFTSTWTGADFMPAAGQTACFRIVAYDNYAGDKPHQTSSANILFQTADPNDLSAAAAKMAAETQATLDKLVALQSENLARTRGFTAREQSVTPDECASALAAQQQVREIAGALIADPRKPLASMQQKIEPLYSHEMAEAVSLLGNLPTADAGARVALVAQAITKEDFILHILSGVDSAYAKADRDRRIADTLALMDALVRDQTKLDADTAAAAAVNATAVAALTKKQDRLSGDADAFVSIANAEAANMKGADENFAVLLAKVAGEFGTRAVPPDMLRAAEQLDAGTPAKAQPIQARVLKNLKELQMMLNTWRAESAAVRAAEILAAFQKAETDLRRLAANQEKVVASIKAWKATEDATTGKESDTHEQLAKTDAATKEAMLQIAADLQIFPEAQLGNEVVKDISTAVAKVDQVAGSEHEMAPERDLQKEDWLLKDIEKMADRIKDGLPTLPNVPTNANFTTEDFDKQEFPGKVAAVPLADKFEDLIGDLLKLDQGIEDKTKSSATNQAFKDMYMEGPVAEGEWSNYSAKGKSGNTKPKDNEQAGRSNIGRQGMSDGETAAASGKINQGNDDIKKRMTQDAAQSEEMGKIDDSQAKTVATGGGKLSGNADQYGMSGAGPRRDARDGSGGNGMAALIKKRADALYATASLQHVRTGSLDEAIMHMRDAQDAEEEDRPISEVREYRRLAVEALRKSQVELRSGMTTESIDSAGATRSNAEEMSSAADEAPAAYQEMVSDYYKSITNPPRK